MFPVAFIVLGFVAYVAYKTKKTPVPRTRWKRFHETGTTPLDEATCNDLQGIYGIAKGQDCFGKTAVLKWSYTIENGKTINHLSLFCGEDGAYFVCEARRSGNDILLYGYWRKLTASETGTVQLVISPSAAVDGLVYSKGSKYAKHFFISGSYGRKEHKPDQSLAFEYQRPLPPRRPLQIIAHRGGSRNVDFLPVSENSLDMMKMAARLGATGVEIDVRLTKDGVPVIIHDSFLSMHTVKGSLYSGLVSNYSLAELKQKELKKGGVTPTLEEALHTVLYGTPLEMIWLDIKKECDLQPIRNLQMTYLQKAKEIGRNLVIYIGVPDEMILECFKALDDHLHVPVLTELEPEVAQEIHAQVWAPQYTKGIPSETIQCQQSEGRKVYVWSLDDPTAINLYLKEGGYDGIVTNLPPVVAYCYYIQEESRIVKR